MEIFYSRVFNVLFFTSLIQIVIPTIDIPLNFTAHDLPKLTISLNRKYIFYIPIYSYLTFKLRNETSLVKE